MRARRAGSVFRPQADDIVVWNHVHGEHVTVPLESVTNCTAVISDKISARLIITAKPELLVLLKQLTVIKKLSVDHRETPGINVNVTRMITHGLIDIAMLCI